MTCFSIGEAMTVYMVRDALTGAWYKRGRGYEKTWVSQNRASIWTEKQGACGCLGTIRKRNRSGHSLREPHVVSLNVVEIP